MYQYLNCQRPGLFFVYSFEKPRFQVISNRVRLLFFSVFLFQLLPLKANATGFSFLFSWHLCFVIVSTSGLSVCACPWPSLRCVPGRGIGSQGPVKLQAGPCRFYGCLIETLGPLFRKKEMCVYIFVLACECVCLYGVREWVRLNVCMGKVCE